jgi:hypothetical protein
MFPPRTPFFKVLLNINGAGKAGPSLRTQAFRTRAEAETRSRYAVTASRSISGA